MNPIPAPRGSSTPSDAAAAGPSGPVPFHGVPPSAVAISLTLTAFPLPGSAPAVVAAQAPGAGVGYWAGGAAAVLSHDGEVVIGYRVRHGARGRSENVIARARPDGSLDQVLVLAQERWNALAMEKPALVARADGGWTLFVCLADPHSKNWWIERLDASTLEGLADAQSTPTLARDAQTAVKDPIVEMRDGTHGLVTELAWDQSRISAITSA